MTCQAPLVLGVDRLLWEWNIMITDRRGKGDTADFEFVLGVVAPIGTDLESLFSHFERELFQYRYSTSMIRLSALLARERQATISVDGARIDGACIAERLMNAGDQLRKSRQSADALAAVAVGEIMSRRDQMKLKHDQTSRQAWILRTLKHPKEVELLRHVYGSRFILVAAQQNEVMRLEKLRGDLSDEFPGGGSIASLATSLIDRDQWDSENEYGQRVRETFSLADYFLNLDGDVEQEVGRLIGLLFGKAFVTPTRDEQAMFHAHAASFRSSDSGRQVGAVVTNRDGEILVTGTNEVPAAGGGSYWPDDRLDKRDFRQGYDYNRRMSVRVVKEMLSYLTLEELVSDKLKNATVDEQYKVLTESNPEKWSGLRLNSLIEFGRVSHAEMSAITQAARSSVSINNATIYTTTFPCHMCMRLIISSGITRIVYIDPYPKSLAMDMYRDSLIDSRQIELTSFWGTSWRVFPYLFQKINRDKDADGTFSFGHDNEHRMRLAGGDPLAGSEEREIAVRTSLELRKKTGWTPSTRTAGRSRLPVTKRTHFFTAALSRRRLPASADIDPGA